MSVGERFVPVLGLAFGALLACIEEPPVRFPHAVHLADQQCQTKGPEACLSCGSCHQSSSSNTREMSLPKPELCSSCHKDSGVAISSQKSAQTQFDFSSTIRFSHQRHLAMPELLGQCVPCHAGVAYATGGASPFPPMEKCFECHEHKSQWDSGRCAPCHDRKDIERVLPVTFLQHDSAFLRKHGALARSQEKVCAQCHTQSDCDDCHDLTQRLRVERRLPEELERNFVHRGDPLASHSIEARAGSASCMRCHDTASCDDCHLERGVSANRRLAESPHPPGWMGSFAGGSNFHGNAARRDIVSCAACHDQGPATNCIECHKPGAYGGNPHPGGWQSARAQDDAMCRYCHEP